MAMLRDGVIGDVLRLVSDAGAKTVAIDVMFSEKEQFDPNKPGRLPVDQVTPDDQSFADAFKASGYEIKPLIRRILLSKDFYSPTSMATQIKSPAVLVVSTYKKLGLRELPTIPDFGRLTGSLEADCRKAQRVRVLGRHFSFRPGESIHTESSYKYSFDRFAALAQASGWQVKESWTDKGRMFSVHALSATAD